MSQLKRIRLLITTDTAGAATVNGNRSIIGRLFAVAWVQGGLAATTDATLSTQGAEGSDTFLTLTNVTANGIYYPREVRHDVVGAALTVEEEMPLLVGIPRVVIAQGGAVTSGSVTLFYYD